MTVLMCDIGLTCFTVAVNAASRAKSLPHPLSDCRMGWIDEVVREFAVTHAARPCARRGITQAPSLWSRPAATGRDRRDNSRTDFSGKPLGPTTALTDALRVTV